MKRKDEQRKLGIIGGGNVNTADFHFAHRRGHEDDISEEWG